MYVLINENIQIIILGITQKTVSSLDFLGGAKTWIRSSFYSHFFYAQFF